MKKQKEIIPFIDQEISLWIPDQSALQIAHESKEEKNDFPFWAKLWPSATILAEFIQDYPLWVTQKKVLELAAGLGLPSLYASYFASSVFCSDNNINAVAFIKENIALNAIHNMEAGVIDWCHLPDELEWDVLLMSDVNYDPNSFENLLQLIQRCMANGKTIILSTPQRLAGKAFITAILPYCIMNEERMQDGVAINVLVLNN